MVSIFVYARLDISTYDTMRRDEGIPRSVNTSRQKNPKFQIPKNQKTENKNYIKNPAQKHKTTSSLYTSHHPTIPLLSVLHFSPDIQPSIPSYQPAPNLSRTTSPHSPTRQENPLTSQAGSRHTSLLSRDPLSSRIKHQQSTLTKLQFLIHHIPIYHITLHHITSQHIIS